MLKRANLLMFLASALTVLGLSGSVSAHSRPPLWAHGFEVVSSVSPSTVTLKHQAGPEQTLAVSKLRVQAAMYPASPTILRPGERVNVFQAADHKSLVVVHPAAYGTLKRDGVLWTVASKRHGVMAVAGRNPKLLGMKGWTEGARVMVFGTLGTQRVEATAVAAPPLLAPSIIQSANVDKVTLKSDQYGQLSFALNQLPNAFRQQLAAMTPGQTVIAGLDPVSHQVLMVWPNHVQKWAHTLERGTSGTVVAVSPKDLTITNQLGTVTIPLDHPAKLTWPGHADAKVTQLTPGTRVIAVRHKDGTLNIMVVQKEG